MGVLVSDRPEAGAYRVTSGGAGAAAETPLPVSARRPGQPLCFLNQLKIRLPAPW
jgi:hypothetical protein